MASPHFDAQLSPGPHVSNISGSLVQGAHKVGHNLHEVLDGLGLDSPDLGLAGSLQVEVTGGFVRAPHRPRDLRVARDDPVPELLPQPLQ